MSKRQKLKPVDFVMSPDELDRMIYPPGVVPADVRKQMRGRHWLSEVRYYYRDEEIVCRDCGKQETWTVAQQKLWYEEWAGDPNAIAVRCRGCRKKRKENR